MRRIKAAVVGSALGWVSVGLTSVYAHRYLAHDAYRLDPRRERQLALATWLFTGNDLDRWVALHRQHHRYADRPGDPHSPIIDGFWPIVLGRRRSYRRMSKNEELVAKLRPTEYRRASYQDLQPRWAGPVVLYSTLGLVVRRADTLAIIGLAHLIVGFATGNVLAAACHSFGARPHQVPGTNLGSLAVITWGESYHNNHHRNPRSPRFAPGLRDIGATAASLLARSTPRGCSAASAPVAPPSAQHT